MVVLSKIWTTAAVALAAGACFATAAGIVYFLRMEEKAWDDSDHDFHGPRSGLKEETSTKYSVVEVAVPTDLIGSLIGRQGSNIARIQAETKTKIKFNNQVFGEDVSIAVIRGKPVDVAAAELEIKKFIFERQSIISFELEIPSSAFNAFMGKDGANIRMINETSRARVDVASRGSSGSNDTIQVTIKGTEQEIELAMGLIMVQVYGNERIQKERERGEPQLSMATRQYELNDKGNDDEDEENGEVSAAAAAALVSHGLPKVEQLVSTTQDGFIDVFVSAVISPSRFWVQLVGTKSIELDKMDEQMAEFYNDQNHSDEHRIVDGQVKTGDMLAAPFGHDGGWYRVEVVDMKPDELQSSEVVVYYADYGERETVELSTLRRLRSDFVGRLPYQAIECSLANVSPATDGSTKEWSSDAIVEFEKLTYSTQWKVVMVRVEGRSAEGVNLVTLVDTNGGNDVDVGELLVHERLAIDNRTAVSRH